MAEVNLAYESEAFQRRLRAAGRSPETIKTYLKAINQFREFLVAHGRNPNAIELDRALFEDYLNEKRDLGAKSATLAQHYRSLQQFAKFIGEENQVASPMTGMKSPTIAVIPPPVITDEALELLFAACKGSTFDDRRDMAVIAMFVDTGVRRSEMASMKIADLDINNQTIWVTGKTGTRAVPFGGTTATHLDRYLRVRSKHPHTTDPALWLGRKGALTHFGIEGIVQTRGEKAGIKIHPHLFRHTFAHSYLLRGGNEGDLQRLAGWSSGQMLQRYGASAAGVRARRAYLTGGLSPVDNLGKKKA